jgi:hypothetical protein
MPDELAEKRQETQRKRVKQNQRITYGECARSTGDADRDIAA